LGLRSDRLKARREWQKLFGGHKQVLVTGFIPPQTLCAAAEDDVTVNIYNFQELGLEQIDCPLLARAQPEGQSLG